MKSATISLLFAACALAHSATAESSTPVFVYEPLWSLPQLTPQQNDNVLAIADAHAPTNQSVWAVLVADSGDRIKTEIYYTHDQSAGRVQKGKMVVASQLTSSSPLSVWDTRRYCCVAPSVTEPFVLSTNQLPFLVEGKLTDKEIVEIFDVCMTEKRRNPGFPEDLVDNIHLVSQQDGHATFLRKFREYQNAPILSIRVRTGQIVEVKTAIARRPLAGRGSHFTLEKKDGKWIVTKRGLWLS